MTFTEGRSGSRGGYAVDLAERVLATAAQAGIAELLIVSADWPQWLAVPIMAGLAVVKGWLARVVGHRDSASLAPSI